MPGAALERNRSAIARILDEYGVPRLPVDAIAGPDQGSDAPGPPPKPLKHGENDE